MTPRAVTGLGVVSALGAGPAEYFFERLAYAETVIPGAAAVFEAREAKGGAYLMYVDLCATDDSKTAAAWGSPSEPHSGVVTSFNGSAYGEHDLRVVEVPEFDAAKFLGDKGLRTLDRLTKLLVVAARFCLQDAGLKNESNAWAALGPEQVGVVCSNAYGSLEAITELDRVAQLEDARYINPAKFPNTVSNSASGYVSIWEELRALNVSVSDGNCGALDALGCADLCLATARADALVTGGGEAMSEGLFLAFEKLGFRDAHGAFSKAFRLGEGAAWLALEPLSRARARGARIRGLVLGYGTAFVPSGSPGECIVASREAMIRAIVAALEDAAVSAHDVDLVVSGVSGLAPFDSEELAAIQAALGDNVTVTAPKVVFGETLGAGGALGMAAALAWLGGARIAPSLVATTTATSRGLRGGSAAYVVVTTMGYYGNASAVVMGRA